LVFSKRRNNEEKWKGREREVETEENLNKYMKIKLFYCRPWMRCGGVRV